MAVPVLYYMSEKRGKRFFPHMHAPENAAVYENPMGDVPEKVSQ
jgi:hypothetical protein